MIIAITAQLEAFKAKVQATIDHVQGGVNHLNEDQQDQAVEMMHNLGEEFFNTKESCLEALGVETLSQRLAKAQADEAAKLSSVEPPAPAPEPPVDPPAEPQSSAADPSAADLDAVANEEKAKEETAAKVEWSGHGLKEKIAEEIHEVGDSVGNALGEAFDNRGQ